MDAEDRVLLYRGVRIAPSEVATFRTQAELLSAQLRDCYPHCNPTKQVVMANCRRAIGEVLVQLAEASHDAELEASIHGSVSSGPSGCSTLAVRMCLSRERLPAVPRGPKCLDGLV